MKTKMRKVLAMVLAIVLVGTMTTGGSRKNVEAAAKKPGVTYGAWVEYNGWLSNVSNGKSAGTTGASLRVEAIRLKLTNAKGAITYRTHVQDTGWTSWVKNGQRASAKKKGLRVEAIQIKLSGEISKEYDVYYRTHVQDRGWMSWTKNGKTAGTTGKGLRVEAYQVQLVKKGAKPVNKSTSGQKAKVSFGKQVADYACQFNGNPYRWGGTSLTNGADCSGFVMSVYAHFGVGLPHSSVGMRSCGREVGIAGRQPGDVICYSQMYGNSHVGIYIGNNQVINAASSKSGICIKPYNYRPICNVRRMK
ncbi:MAG: NlpC/P60 family protein [Lachnospiraceae bacterium]